MLITVVWVLQAGAKSTAASSLKFQAEATAHLQNSGVPRTQDAPKYEDKTIEVSTCCHSTCCPPLPLAILGGRGNGIYLGYGEG